VSGEFIAAGEAFGATRVLAGVSFFAGVCADVSIGVFKAIERLGADGTLIWPLGCVALVALEWLWGVAVQGWFGQGVGVL